MKWLYLSLAAIYFAQAALVDYQTWELFNRLCNMATGWLWLLGFYFQSTCIHCGKRPR
jgi:hypothetical protein